MKKYTVKHYHTKAIGLTYEDFKVKVEYTEDSIEAGSSKEAATIAHGLYNGYTMKDLEPNPTSPGRTIRERMEDEVVFDGKNADGGDVYHYDSIANHWIIVEEV